MIFTNNIDPILLSLGALDIRWYGLFFAVGILVNYLILEWIFRREKLAQSDLESLVIYLFLGLVIGARLGHVFFYNWAYFSQHPGEILMIWEGGLASHGAAIGLFVAVGLWSWMRKVSFSKYVDYLVVPMPLTAMCVRIGNFFNSEIVGVKTGGDWGVIFKKLGEDFPRHPSQLYEAVAALVVFLILMWMYKRGAAKVKYLLLFTFVGLYFGARFLLEYYKDLHVFSADFPLSMGQVLSILPVTLALGYFLFYYRKFRKN